ncbi:MAG: DUF1800 family protein [Candidatus Hydrogenedens sp.]|nr:DUF1800 family protein [Candidatus Hydrogenedens sp.]
MALFDEYQVGADGPWTTAEAAHLWRRAGFGAGPAEQRDAAGNGSQAALRSAVDFLVDFTPDDPWLDRPAGLTSGGYGDPLADLPDDESDLGRVKTPYDLISLIGHWLYRMRYTRQPFQEKLTLFLHDHFVSEWAKLVPLIDPAVIAGNDGNFPDIQQCDGGTLGVDLLRANRIAARMMLDQNYLLRRQGIDSFRAMLISITRDPCMLMYLDNVVNEKGRAQENYARELMELFSMGVGNYSEQDVREVAKCLTGETLPRFVCENDWDFSYGFDAAKHEPGTKTFFGKTIQENFAGQEALDVIDFILAERSKNPDVTGLASPYNTLPATAVYMAWKLLKFFVNEELSLDPPDEAVLELAHYLRGTDNQPYPKRRFPYDFRAALRKVFLSKFFYAEENRLNQYRNPAEFVTHLLRQGDFADLFATQFGPGTQMTLMGMILFNPPGVNGWYHGRAWITSGSLVARYNYVSYLMDTIFQGAGADARIDALLAANGGPIPDADSDDDLIDYYAERLLQMDLNAEERTTLRGFLSGVDTASPALRFRQKVRGLIHVMMSMPLAQLK